MKKETLQKVKCSFKQIFADEKPKKVLKMTLNVEIFKIT